MLAAASVGAEAAMILNLPFNGNANDTSGYGHNGTVYGATPTQDRFGNANSAYYFNGSGDYIDLGTQLLPSGDFTVGFWLKSAGTQNTYTVPLSQGHWGNPTSSGFAFQYGFPAASSIGFIWGRGTFNTFEFIDFNYNLTTDTVWHHLVATKQGNTITAYEDSVSAGSSSVGLLFGSYNFVIGQDAYNSGRSFYGSIDDVRVFDYALTSAQVGELYADNFVPEPSAALLLALGGLWLGHSGARRRQLQEAAAPRYSSFAV